MSQNPETIAQLKRKVARLEAMLQAAESFIKHDGTNEYLRIQLCVEQEMRMKQAVEILNGNDE